MLITYSFRNATSESVNHVIMRKFFQMVFMGNDKKSIHIYTATILGANSQYIQPEKNRRMMSDFSNISSFQMVFDCAVSNVETHDIESIRHNDITSDSHGLFEEIDCIKKVWGNKCEIINENQLKIEEKLKLLGVNLSSQETAALTRHKLLWVEQKKNRSYDKDLNSLAIHGTFQELDNATQENIKEYIMRKAYVIGIPVEITKMKSIELVNWIKTTITFKNPIDDRNLNFVLRKEATEKEHYSSPDFTWYFSPVVRSAIDNKNCLIEVKRQQDTQDCQASQTLCPYNCQYRKQISDKYQNSIDGVPNKLTVDFWHWEQEEKIDVRKKYRMAAKEIFPDITSIDTLSEINIYLDVTDEHGRSNRQFIFAIFIAFLLSFGIDSARIQSVERCFRGIGVEKFLPPDIMWLIFLSALTLTWVNKPVNTNEKYQCTFKLRKFTIAISIVWAVVTFWFSRIFTAIQDFNEQIPVLNILYLFTIGCHFWYLHRCKAFPKEPIIKDFFHGSFLS